MLKNQSKFVVYVSPKGVIIAKCELKMDTKQFLVGWAFIFFTDNSCSKTFSDSVKKSLDMISTTLLSIRQDGTCYPKVWSITTYDNRAVCVGL